MAIGKLALDAGSPKGNRTPSPPGDGQELYLIPISSKGLENDIRRNHPFAIPHLSISDTDILSAIDRMRFDGGKTKFSSKISILKWEGGSLATRGFSPKKRRTRKKVSSSREPDIPLAEPECSLVL